GPYASTAGDALLNCWKAPPIPWSDGLPGISYAGIYNGNIANRDVVLCAGSTASADIATNCAVSTAQKDLLAEVDYMEFHLPDPVAVGQVVQVFADPTHTPPGPVRLHLQIDEQITHNNTTALVPCTAAGAAGD